MLEKIKSVKASISMLLPYLNGSWKKNMEACIDVLDEVIEEMDGGSGNGGLC